MSKPEINIQTKPSIKIIPFLEMEDPEELAFSEPEAYIYLTQIGVPASFENLHRHFFKRKGWYILKSGCYSFITIFGYALGPVLG